MYVILKETYKVGKVQNVLKELMIAKHTKSLKNFDWSLKAK